MKHKLSITIEEDTLYQLREIMRTKTFRNKSHFFEVAAVQLIQQKGGD